MRNFKRKKDRIVSRRSLLGERPTIDRSPVKIWFHRLKLIKPKTKQLRGESRNCWVIRVAKCKFRLILGKKRGKANTTEATLHVLAQVFPSVFD